MYAELHCHSHYSLLDGASAPEALVARAVELRLPALALTDHDGLYGAVAFWRAAQGEGVQPIIGAELTLAHGSHLTLLAENQTGYANLSRLISRGQLAGSKGQPVLTIEEVAQHAARAAVPDRLPPRGGGRRLCWPTTRRAARRRPASSPTSSAATGSGSSSSATGCPTTPGSTRGWSRPRRPPDCPSSPPTTSTTPPRPASRCTICSPRRACGAHSAN